MDLRRPEARVALPAWRLELLGGATLRRMAGGRNPEAFTSLERKTAGVLALLAMDGECSRSRVAGLLWPSTEESAARTNLRQCLYRLKKLSGTDLLHTGERLSLTAALEVDTVSLESRAFLGDDAGLIAVRGEILEQYDFEDCPEFTEWLEMQRLRWRAARVGAYRRALQHPDASEALEWAREWITLEPLSEEAHRALALVYAARGNRALALDGLRQLETLLRRELNAAPSAESRQLYSALERDELTWQPVSLTLPAEMRQPPLLAGREQQWEQLERAWAAGQDIIVRGAAGVGKTRLMLDFLRSKASFDLIAARPSDAGVPMATFARVLRQILSIEASVKVPAWVKTELARLIPEFGPTPPPMTSEADRDRFYEALFTVSEHRFKQGIAAIALDDVQFMDAASFEAALANTQRARRLGIRLLAAYRSGELNAALEAQIEQALKLGNLLIIDLEPLEEVSLTALVQSLHLGAPSELARDLRRSTGGNPLYALETIRDLLERDALRADLEGPPALDSAQHVIAHRLERRSREAQRIAQVAAVAGEDFSLELASAVMDCKPLELHEPLLELERAQIMRGERFQHDLLQETVLTELSLSLKRFLHRRCAAFLDQDGDPYRVGAHWLEGGDLERAIPFLLKAGERAKSRYELREAARAFQRAGESLEALQKPEQAFMAYQQQAELLSDYDLGDAHERLVEKLLELSQTPQERALAWTQRATLLHRRGQGPEAERAARTALEFAETLSQPSYVLNALDGLIQAVYVQGGRGDELIVMAQRARDIALSLGLAETVAEYDNNLAVLFERQDRLSESAEHFRRAVTAFRAKENVSLLVGTLTNFGSMLADAGYNQQALQTLNEAQVLLERLPEDLHRRFHVQLNRLGVFTAAGRYRDALATLQQLQQLGMAYPNESSTHIPRLQCELMLRLGAFDEARAAAKAVLEQTEPRVGRRVYALVYRSCTEPEAQALQTLAEARRLVQNALKRPLALERVRLCQVPLLSPEDGLEQLRQSKAVLDQFDHPGLNLTASLRSAQCHWRLGNLEPALAETRAILRVFPQVLPELVYHAEVLFTVAQVLSAADQPDARIHLERAVTWVLETNRDQVPAEYRERFLNINPVNRAILALARAAQIEIRVR